MAGNPAMTDSGKISLLRATALGLEIQCQGAIGGNDRSRGLLAIDRAAFPAVKRTPPQVAGTLGAERRHRLRATRTGRMLDVRHMPSITFVDRKRIDENQIDFSNERTDFHQHLDNSLSRNCAPQHP
jgi:hypothetical protein